MASAITLNSSIVASPEQVSTSVGEEVIILSTRDGFYYGLSGVGARVWELVQAPRLLREVHEALTEEYQVAPEILERDLLTLAMDLAAHTLINVEASSP
jgi:hypothetical protein